MLKRSTLTKTLLLTSLLLPLAGQGQALPPLEVSAPAGDVLRPGHLGRQTGDIEQIVHFYYDLLGTGLRGERDEPRPFWTSPGLIEFANTPQQADFRAVILHLPGTTAEAGGVEMTVEAIEFRNMERHQYVQNLDDIGGSHLVLLVRNLDSAVSKLKEEGVRIVTEGEEPVAVPLMYGDNRTKRAIIVRDPDGYPVELVELTPTPATTAPADSNLIGARISVTVEDLAASTKLYEDLVGSDMKFWTSPDFVKDEAYNTLRATPNAEYRYASALIPGSPVYLEFVQYRGVEQRNIDPILQDIGTAHALFMVDDMDVMMPRLAAAGMSTLSPTGGPVFIGPTTHALFSKELNNFFIEFMASTAAAE
ncbi:MAG TPA: VOC family protein [Hyphomicrobiales bacterium]|nr:VOC family protein [Hyphomicrobiales bacterium]